MLKNKYRLKPLIIAIILGLFAPCACAFIVDIFEGNMLTTLLSNTLILEIALVAGIGVLPDMVTTITILQYPNAISVAPSVFIGLAGKILRPLSVVLLLLYIAVNQPAGLNAIGIPQKASGVILLLLGSFIAYGAFSFMYALGYKLVTKNKTPDKNTSISKPAFNIFSPYKAPWERIAFSLAMFLGVVSEELLYRGYLVLLWGERSDLTLLWALISIILFVSIHLYQGRSAIIFHTLFAIVVTVITILTGNIIIAVGMHGLHNIVVSLKIWDAIDGETAPQNETAEDDKSLCADLPNHSRNETNTAST